MSHNAYEEARSLSGLFVSPIVSKIAGTILDLIYPPSCVHCGRVDAQFCPSCLQTLLEFPIHDIRHSVPWLVEVASTGIHEGILQSAVQALKYHGERTLANALGLRLADRIQSVPWKFDTIVPVPLHSGRLRERGYNQSQEMASVLANAIQIECIPQAIERIRATQSQVTLTRSERLTNLEQAFRALPEYVDGQILLLVDDVQTTGSTVANCAQAALEAGAKAVYGITVTVARI